jgi:hypothetical protein
MALEFFTPLLVVVSGRENTLADVGDAIRFLDAWPEGQRDAMWTSALRCCEHARDGRIGVPSARRVVESWARQNDVLGSWVTRSRRVVDAHHRPF